MKIEELSIGDWVVAKLTKWDYDCPEETEPMRIRCIDNSDRKRAYADLEFGSGQYATSAHIEDLCPIPISAEALKQNGWREDKTDPNFFATDEVYIYNHEGVWRLRPKSTELLIVVDVKHIHELQHALRLLGVEKEIILYGKRLFYLKLSNYDTRRIN